MNQNCNENLGCNPVIISHVLAFISVKGCSLESLPDTILHEKIHDETAVFLSVLLLHVHVLCHMAIMAMAAQFKYCRLMSYTLAWSTSTNSFRVNGQSGFTVNFRKWSSFTILTYEAATGTFPMLCFGFDS